MKPNNTEAATVQSNISSDNTGQFTVDQDSLAHIMSVLTNLYADPELAVIREYLTNAYDSHIEAAELDPNYVKRPIEVSTPSHFNKAYVIKDYGLGMSIDDLKNTYSKYGASTKRNSDTVVGMLGLGSKSALTYTNSFTITAVKNGRKAMAIISVNEEGVPVFHVVHDETTSEPNGVEIKIPVKDRNTFATKTQNFVKYWPEDTVLVDGSEPAKHGYEKIDTVSVLGPDSVPMDAEVFLAPTNGSGYYAEAPKSYVVMGNVPYEVDSEYIPSDLGSLRVGFVAYVPIGAVTIVPSREKLYYNTRTKDVIKTVGTGLAEKVIQGYKDKIDSAPDYVSAYHLITEMSYELRSTSFFRNGVTYNGEAMPSAVYHEMKRVNWDYNGRSEERSPSSVNIGNYMHADKANQTVIVTDTGFTHNKDKQIASAMRRKAKYWAESNGYNTREVLFVNDDIDTPWFSHLPRVTAKVIEAIKIPRSPSGVSRPKEVPYDFYSYIPKEDAVVTKKGTVVKEAVKAYVQSENTIAPPKGRKVYYISPADLAEDKWFRATRPYTLVERFQDDNITLAVMGTNRFEKFLRQYPNAQHFKHYAQEYVTKAARAISDIHLVVDKFENEEEEFCKIADSKRIDDPSLAKFIDDYQNDNDTDAMSRLMRLTEFLKNVRIKVDIPDSTTDREPFLDYPLVGLVGAAYVEHMYTYINAHYKNI